MDPLEQARGERGYVFPAFTALPIWSPQNEGEPTWTEFDIAAFKEALKTLNQFRQKTEERRILRTRRINLREWIENADKTALKNSVDRSQNKEVVESEEGETEPTFHGDKRIEVISELVAQFHKNQEEVLPPLDRGESGSDYDRKTLGYRILFGTLRGFFDLRDEWNRIYKNAKGEPSVEDSEEAVREKQRADRYGIGSAPLFFRLCEKQNWDLWRELIPASLRRSTINLRQSKSSAWLAFSASSCAAKSTGSAATGAGASAAASPTSPTTPASPSSAATGASSSAPPKILSFKSEKNPILQ